MALSFHLKTLLKDPILNHLRLKHKYKVWFILLKLYDVTKKLANKFILFWVKDSYAQQRLLKAMEKINHKKL